MERHLICLLVCTATLSFITAQDFYPTPDSTYTWDRAYPQSCECMENGVSKSKCDLFKCTCQCDLTAGMCDYNCCCDPDCTSTQVDQFKEQNDCLYEGVPDTIEYCYDSRDLYGVNPRAPMAGQSTAQQAVGNALCVEKKNGRQENDYYTASSIKNSDVFYQAQGQKEFNYYEEAEALSSGAVLNDASYDRGDSIAAFQDVGLTRLRSNGPGYLQVPSPDFSGVCNDNNYATFATTEPGTSYLCLRRMSADSDTFDTQCLNKYSVAAYVTDLWLAKTADTRTADSSLSKNSAVNILITSVKYEDFASGDLTTVSAEWNSDECTTNVVAPIPESNASNPCEFATSDTLTLYSELGVSRMCSSLVKEVDYTIEYAYNQNSGKQEIINATATVVITDVPFEWDAGQDVIVNQKFSVTYASADKQSPSFTAGNRNTRRRSGNPGYIYGKPVLYGYLDGSNDWIRELQDGYAVASSLGSFDISTPSAFGSGQCPTSDFSAAPGIYNGLTKVEFGYDFTSGCTVSLTREEMVDFCCTGSDLCSASSQSLYTSSNGIPYFFNVTSGGYIGAYGNADPSDSNQWLPMDIVTPEPSTEWSSVASTCFNMYTGLNVKFLVARTGEKLNPQNKIISALTEITTSDIVFPANQLDTNSKYVISLTVSVSFIFQEEGDIRGYAPPARPILFKVPYDVFYPFYTDTSTSGVASSSIAARSSRGIIVTCLLGVTMLLLL